MLPILLGVAPFGLIYGIAALNAGIPPLQALLMSSVVFSGSAQFAATQLIAHGALASVVILTILVVNLRHVMYSATIAPASEETFHSLEIISGIFVDGRSFCHDHYPIQRKTGYALQRMVLLWSGFLTLGYRWQIATAVGIFAGGQVPCQLVIGFHHCIDIPGFICPIHSGSIHCCCGHCGWDCCCACFAVCPINWG